ncbi:MAG: PCRF domain-containing protein, partial [Anaerolineae bacterium]
MVSKIWLLAWKLSGGVFDLPGKIQELEALNAQSADPNLWNDPDNAREVMQRLAALQEDVQYWTGLRQEIHDTQEFFALGDEDLFDELEQTADKLEQEVGQAEFRLLLSGPYDRGD